MAMKNAIAVPRLLALAGFLFLVGWTPYHLELTASFPEADQVLTEAPTVIWLQFSVTPDMERSSFSVRGAAGNVELGDIAVGDSVNVLRAEVSGAMPAGDYTLSWVGAPLDDHAVRGRYSFSVSAARR